VLVYETDIGDHALISGRWNGAPVMLYVEGMPGPLEGRGQHDGVWIDPPGAAGCAVGLSGPDGRQSHSWGRLQLVFDRPAFPSGFALQLGLCRDPLGVAQRAEPALR